ncbi:Ppx/GppA family phosphatase [Streptomyces sp. NPDC059002]|uniref:Ppx/GppA phosphatase family protein n=1 Tax=Streptomyces sp. NPDC059002 TaxID=3346690 RepID=UPI003684A682
MRLSVLDVGSRTVRLVVADAEGGAPLPVHTAKWKLRLSDHVGPCGRLGGETVDLLADAVAQARQEARRRGAEEPLAFATAVVRDAPNRDEILDRVYESTGVRLRVMSGEAEAELTFLGARRWMGWQAGPLALLDIGGGSLEVAFGRGRLPSFVMSLPLGANRLTREFGTGHAEPPTSGQVKLLRRAVRHHLRDVAARIRWEGPRTVVATSRTFQQLGRLCGATPGRHGPFVTRTLRRSDLRRAQDRLAALPKADRAELPGISAPRAAQSLAGAVVGHTAMKLMDLDTVTICPWAIREGILLRRMEDGPGWWAAADGEEVPYRTVPLRVAGLTG